MWESRYSLASVTVEHRSMKRDKRKRRLRQDISVDYGAHLFIRFRYLIWATSQSHPFYSLSYLLLPGRESGYWFAKMSDGIARSRLETLANQA